MRSVIVPILLTMLNSLAAFAGEADKASETQPQTETPAASTASTWAMSAEQKAELLTLCDRAIAAGFPDPTGGTLIYGSIKVTITKKKGNSRSSNSNAANGLHLRMPDGRILMNLRSVMKNSDTVALDISNTKEVPLSEIATVAQKEQRNQWDAAEMQDYLQEQLKLFVPEDHEKIRAMYQYLAFVELAQGQGSDLAGVTLVMLKLNVPNAEILAVASAMNSIWNQVGMDFYKGTPTALILRQEDNWQHQRDVYEEAQKKGNLRLPEMTAIMRMGLAGFFIGQLVKFDDNDGDGDSDADDIRIKLPPEKAGAAALAMLEDAGGDLTAVRQEIERMKQRALINQVVAKDADLATVLMGWENDHNNYSSSDNNTIQELEEQLQHATGRHRTQVLESIMRLRIQLAPLNELFTLLNDERPSRWLDQYRVRSVGDNALRAIAQRYGCDPRLLIGRDTQARWSVTERKETISALQAWWDTNKDKPLAEQLGGVIGKIALADQVRLLKQAEDQQRTALVAAIVKQWQQEPPKDPEAEALGRFLFYAGDQAEVIKIVDAWPVAGDLRILLAAWHLGRGDSAHYDALLQEQLARKPVVPKAAGKPKNFFNGAASQTLRQVIRIAARYPNAERLNRLMSAINNPIAGDDGKDLLSAVTSLSWGISDELSSLWDEDNSSRSDDKDKQKAMSQAATGAVLYGLLLQDQRPAPAEMVKQYGNQTQYDNEGNKKKQPPPAADLRICDIAAMTFSQMTWRLPLNDLLSNRKRQNIHQMKLDLSATKADRDAQLLAFRQVIASIAPALLRAAALPEVIPGITDVPAVGSPTEVPVF
jgi:hypothetical protein